MGHSNREIEFEPGDVIGYYVNRFNENGRDRNGGGIQVVSDSVVAIYSRTNVPLGGFQTQYAIPDLSSSDFPCGSPTMALSAVRVGAPIIDLSLSTVANDGIQSTDMPISMATMSNPTPTSSPPLPNTVPLVSSTLLTSSPPLPSVMPISVPSVRNSGSEGGEGGRGGGAGDGSPILIWVAVAIILVVLILTIGMQSISCH